MKHLFITLALSGVALAVNAQGRSEQDSTIRYYNQLAASANPADQVLLEGKLYQLLKSDKEQDWLMARRFFFILKKNNTVDSINEASAKRFPLGDVARNKAVNVVYDEKDANKKEAAYKAWIAKFPPTAPKGKNDIAYDYARFGVATAFAAESNIPKTLEYAHMIENPIWKGEGLAGTANALLRAGHNKEGLALYHEALNSTKPYLTGSNRHVDGAGFAINNYLYYNSAIAGILLKDNKATEAYSYIKIAHDSAKALKPAVNATYFDVLMALGKKQEALETANESMIEGQASENMKAAIKQLYLDVKGANADYDAYIAAMNKAMVEKINREVAGKLIDQPAPSISFTDVNGKTVSLEDVKGKVVVLDFWATWCGPCKRSFPAMKMAVEKYKDNPDVKFLFIHTWEKVDKAAATASAKKYIDDQKYPFELWMDLKDPSTGQNNGVEGFKVNGIPAKFVLDRKGHIRFSMSGFSGGDEAAVAELSAMIEMAEKKS